MTTTPPDDLIKSGQDVLAQMTAVALDFDKIDRTAPAIKETPSLTVQVSIQSVILSRSSGSGITSS